ncbi:uncharacterized protein F5891DRAFT_1215943 [Suillus fuscotomentosus]|uniref:Uncharacterized protein n=1 Tax=Suillus fuscotomentosus TaxID=1912939 RepID=A0AAD4HD53_9AGAM|nr:uncharacterized protein F5891DRAFT_1215943 [Suillus fuscotomentosus]KAG1889018.1 hypothetical protein F5891DRAFT_1215943 [Suillus fuscotomentosus]
MTSNDSVKVTAVWSDDRNTLENSLRGSDHTVAMAVGILQNHITRHVSRVYGLELDPLTTQARYFPAVQPSDMLRVCRSDGLTALITPNAETNRRIKTQLALNAQANQTHVESNTTSQPSTSAVPPHESNNARRRNAASTANPPQVTMDSQLKEMLASMQKEIAEIRGKTEKEIAEIRGKNEKEIAEIRGKNEKVLSENESIHSENKRILNENESMRGEIESINSGLTSVRRDLDAARVKHTQDVEALRQVTMLLVPVHLRVLLDLARRKVLEHLGYETWEELRASCSIHQLSNKIFDALKQQGVSYTPSHQSILFLCSYNNIRRAGNTAAHSAKEDDIRHAVLTQPLDSRDRECLENLFTYAYNGKQL